MDGVLSEKVKRVHDSTSMKEGRPTKYDPSKNEMVEKLCKLSTTDKQLADFLEVSEATINLWKKEHPEFLESIKRGKEYADANVAERLYQRAMGFEHDSEEIKVVSVGVGQSVIERVKVRKIYPPDATSAIFWLKNRRPKEWREKQEIQHSMQEGQKFKIGGQTIEF